jgi:hypothetical protein
MLIGMALFIEVKISDELTIQATDRTIYKDQGQRRVVDYQEVMFTISQEGSTQRTIASPEAVQALLALASAKRDNTLASTFKDAAKAPG